MTSLAHVHYVISNLISLGLLTIARFQLADNIIWSSALSASESKLKAKRQAMKYRYSYNLHNIVTVASEGELPELEPFKVDTEIQKPSIVVNIGTPRRPKKGENDPDYIFYGETFGRLGFEVGIQLGEQVQVVASPSLKLSPHVLYTNVVEPILRWHFVEKGYALVHGATIAFGDEACIITARTDTGKTTTLLKMLSYQRRDSDQAAFLSDDMTIVSPEGVAMTYPKPLTISAHTLRAVNARTLKRREQITLPFQSRIHSRTGRRFAFFISQTHLPAATINMLMQMVVPPPKYFVSRLVPKVKLAQQAQLKRMFIIERGEEGIVPMDNHEAVEVLLENCEDAYGFPPYESLKEFLYIRHGVDLREKEQQIIRQALEGLPAMAVRSNNYEWWSRIPTFVDNEQVSRDITRAREVEAMGHSVYGRREPVTVSE